MSLLKLYKNYRYKIKNGQIVLNSKIVSKTNIIFIMALVLVFLTGCEEKVPTLPSQSLFDPDSSFLTYRIDDIISDTTFTVDPKIGTSKILILGEDDWCSSYSLLKFSSMPELDGSIDVIKEFKLNLFAADTLEDISGKLALYLIDMANEGEWNEDSSNINNFNLDELIYTQQDGELFQDTLSQYGFNLDFDIYPDDTLNSSLEFALKGKSAEIFNITSGESSLYPRIKLVYAHTDTNYYTVSGTDTTFKDTTYDVTSTIIVSSDISIIDFKQLPEQNERLYLCNGARKHTFIKFDLSEDIPDTNTLIVKIKLHLSIDNDNSYNNYETNTDIKVNWANPDTLSWQDSLYLPTVNNYYGAYSPVSILSDTAVVIDILNNINGNTPGPTGIKDYEIFLSPSDMNELDLLSLYSSSCLDETKRPWLEILTLKEQIKE